MVGDLRPWGGREGEGEVVSRGRSMLELREGKGEAQRALGIDWGGGVERKRFEGRFGESRVDMASSKPITRPRHIGATSPCQIRLQRLVHNVTNQAEPPLSGPSRDVSAGHCRTPPQLQCRIGIFFFLYPPRHRHRRPNCCQTRFPPSPGPPIPDHTKAR